MIVKGLNSDIIKDGKNGTVVSRANMGRSTIMSLVNPNNPKSNAQGKQRSRYFVTSADWNLLSDMAKQVWNQKAEEDNGYPKEVPFKIARNGIELFKQVNNFYISEQGFGLLYPPAMGYTEMEIKLNITYNIDTEQLIGKITTSPDLGGYIFRVIMAVVEPQSAIVWYNQLFLLGYINIVPGVSFLIETLIKEKFGKKPRKKSVFYCKVYGINWNNFTRTNETLTISKP